ncbi:hypothetical protein FOA52_001976 [Chlamydomonas sp. UWO 241]|nr:hypothetical protein FOA52_001976 [Chlamydomonas sp. UWO 241]
MTHEGLGGLGARVDAAGYAYSTVCENVAEGQDSIVEVVRAWMQSPSHRANLLNVDVVHMGGGRVGRYWAQVFGGPCDRRRGADGCFSQGHL